MFGLSNNTSQAASNLLASGVALSVTPIIKAFIENEVRDHLIKPAMTRLQKLVSDYAGKAKNVVTTWGWVGSS